MSRTFIDDALALWEVFPSGGKFGLPQRPKIVFHPLSDSTARSRYDEFGEEVKAVVQPVDMDSAGPALERELIAYCRELLAEARALD